MVAYPLKGQASTWVIMDPKVRKALAKEFALLDFINGHKVKYDVSQVIKLENSVFNGVTRMCTWVYK
jgi:hypothetical protein